MKYFLRAYPLVIVLLSSLYLSAQQVDTAVARMQQVVANYVDNKTYMGAVLVAEKDRVVISQGYGYADLEWSVPNTPTTKFRIGSLTKQFTAACVLLLQERGKLRLDASVKTYLPDAPPAWDKITVYNLLTHTSGIPNLVGGPNWDTYKYKDHTPDESIAFFQDRPLQFTPGEKFVYSNSNYILLGRIIERVSGLPYEQFLQENILTPLQLKNTGVDKDTAVLPQRARGYDAGAQGIVRASYVSMTIPYAAGFLYSTTGDLLTWQSALYNGKVLSPASLKLMTTPFKGGYAMGLNVKDGAHHGVITHNGSINGFDDSLNYYPDSQLSVIVLGNIGNDVPDKLAEQLGKVAHGENVVVTSDRKQVSVAPEVPTEYVGKYSSPSFGVTIVREGDHLLSITPGGKKVPLFPESQTKFFIREFDAQVEFVRDPATKKVSEMVVAQGDNLRKVPKVE